MYSINGFIEFENPPYLEHALTLSPFFLFAMHVLEGIHPMES